MAKCISCNKEVGCACNLQNGKCSTCREKEERKAQQEAAAQRLIEQLNNNDKS
jgi:hypothetical protein